MARILSFLPHVPVWHATAQGGAGPIGAAWATALAAVLVVGMAQWPLRAQPANSNRRAFEVASIRPNKSDAPSSSNVPMGPGDVYDARGGFFRATNLPLITYMAFAYKIMGSQTQYRFAHLPKWVGEDRFDIQARAAGTPSKDEMRLMMQALLADRFGLAVHHETAQVPVAALVLAIPGRTGPDLRPHPADDSCSNPESLPACGGIEGMQPRTPGDTRLGGRNVSIGLIANGLPTREVGRPVADHTGLSGTFDFSLEWYPDLTAAGPTGAGSQPYVSGPSFLEALKEQLGLKLVLRKEPVDVIVVERVKHPSEN